MQILVLGTSNSIVRTGWIDGFRSGLPADCQITNRSIGASPASQFGLTCAEGASGFDVIIIEPVVNDENVRSFVGSMHFFQSLMRGIIGNLAAQSRLIFLGFANSRYEAGRSEVFEFYKSLAEEHGAPFFDVVTFAQTFAPPHFADANHIKRPIAFAFGEQLAKFVETLPPRIPRETDVQMRFAAHSIEVLGAFEVADRRSSLISGTYGILTTGETIHLDAGGQLIGILIDSNQCNCCLKLVGAEGRRDLSFRYDVQPGQLRGRFVPIEDGFPIGRIEVLPYSAGGRASMFENRSPTSEETVFAVSKLLLAL